MRKEFIMKKLINEMKKTAVITGSTKGIGRAIGLKLLEAGYFVVFNYANDENGKDQLEHYLWGTPFKDYKIIKNDFRNEQNIAGFVDDLIEKFPTIDALVLNAGITDRTPWDRLSMNQWEQVLYVNLTMPAFLIQKIGPHLSDSTGSILCIGSVLGKYAHSVSIPYGVSKAGLHFLVKSLVKEFSERKITINGICTGFTDTQWQREKTEEQRNRIKEKIAFKRFAEAEEIAELAYSIIQNRYMTGSIVSIDGGYCCQ